MIMVSFCWKINLPHNKNKNQFRFIDDVLEINDQSRSILSGPPCIASENLICLIAMHYFQERASENLICLIAMHYFQERASENLICLIALHYFQERASENLICLIAMHYFQERDNLQCMQQ